MTHTPDALCLDAMDAPGVVDSSVSDCLSDSNHSAGVDQTVLGDGLPDLIPSDLQANKTTVRHGEDLGAKVQVWNFGSVPQTAYWIVKFYLSTDRNFDPNVDHFLGQDTSSEDIAVAGSRWLPPSGFEPFTVPDTIPTGTYELYAWVQEPVGVPEENYDNNVTRAGETVEVTEGLPDLIPSDLQANKTTVKHDEDLGAKVQVWNFGSVPQTAYWIVKFYLSTDRNFDPNVDHFLGQDTSSEDIAVAGSRWLPPSGFEPFTVPDTIPTGTYELYAWVQEPVGVPEENYDNNVTRAGETVEVTEGLPDLIPSDLQANKTTVKHHEDLGVKVQVWNFGSAPQTAYWIVKFYLSTDRNFDPNVDHFLGQGTSSEDIAVAGSRWLPPSGYEPFTVPDTIPAGTYELYAWVQEPVGVPEENYDNNVTRAGETVTVTGAPEIDVEWTGDGAENRHSFDFETVFGPVAVGGSVTTTFRVENEGTGSLTVSQAAGLGSPFSISPANGSGSGDDWVVAPSGQKQFNITYAPTAAGSHNDTLTLVNNDADESSYQVTFTGRAVGQPEIDVEWTGDGAENRHSFDFETVFGPVAVGGSVTTTFRVENEGTGSLTVSQAAGLGSPFSISPANGSGSGDDWVVAPSGQKQFNITYAPTAAGSHNDTLTLVNNDADESSYQVTFTGRAVGQPEIDVELLPVKTLTASDTLAALPANKDDPLEVNVGQEYYVEVWVKNISATPAGISGGYIDLSYTTALTDATDLDHGGIFTALQDGVIDDSSGLVDDFGGVTFDTDKGDDEWVRLGWGEYLCTGEGTVTVEALPGDPQFALAGTGENVPWNQVDLDSVQIEQASGEADVHMAVVETPTGTDTASAVPTSTAQMVEAHEFWVEVWVRSDPAYPQAIRGGTVTLSYDTRYADAVEIDHGGVFTESPSGSIDDAAGQVVNLGGETTRTDVGDDEYVLLGRVKMVGVAPVDQAAQTWGPYGLGLGAAEGDTAFSLVGSGEVPSDIQPVPSADVLAVVYDVNDSGRVDVADFSLFAPAFPLHTGDPEPPYTTWADYNDSGRVDVADFSLFAPVFGKYCHEIGKAALPPSAGVAGGGMGAASVAEGAPAPLALIPVLAGTEAREDQTIALLAPEAVVLAAADVDALVTDTPEDWSASGEGALADSATAVGQPAPTVLRLTTVGDKPFIEHAVAAWAGAERGAAGHDESGIGDALFDLLSLPALEVLSVS